MSRIEKIIDAADKVRILDRRNHMARARQFRSELHPHLRRWRDDFYDFVGGGYRLIDDATISAELWRFHDEARSSQSDATGPFLPNQSAIAETEAALRALTYVDAAVEMPSWFERRKSDRSPDDLLAFENGILDMRTGRFNPADPRLFTTAVLPFEYGPSTTGARPPAWLDFLNQCFAGPFQQEQINALQEVVGYLLTSDVSLEKAFMIVGPKRSGKGTFLAMVRALLAPDAVAGPTLRTFGETFGLQALIGKQLAIIDDLRIGQRKDEGLLAENVLKITGQGLFTVNRKYKSSWSGRLPIKLLLVSNILPRIVDESGALASRFISFETRVSFLGHEDPNLFRRKLLPEKLEVLHWALVGLRRLRKRGRFEETALSVALGDRLANMGSAVINFVRQACSLEREAIVEKDRLFSAWTDWAKSNNETTGTKEQFFENLYAAFPGQVRPTKARQGDQRVPAVKGLRFDQLPM